MSHFPHVEDLNIEECDNLEDFLYPHQQNPGSSTFETGMSNYFQESDRDLPPVEGDYGMTPLAPEGSPLYTPKMARYEGPSDAMMTSRIYYDDGTRSQRYNNMGYPSMEQANPLRVRANSDMSETSGHEHSPKASPDLQGNAYEDVRFGLTRENRPIPAAATASYHQNALQSNRTYTQAVPNASQVTSFSVAGAKSTNDSESPVVTRGRGRVLRNRRPEKAASDHGQTKKGVALPATATTATKSEAQSVISSNTGYSGETNQSVTARKMKKNNRERQRRYEVNEKFTELAEVLGVVQKNKSDKVSVLQSAIDTVNWFQETYGPVDISEVVNNTQTEANDGGSMSGRKRSAARAGI